MKLSKYYTAAISAFLIWGFFSLALKPLHHYASLDILFYRIFFCAVIMIGINLIFRYSVLKENLAVFKAMESGQKRRIVYLTLGGGLLLTANWFVFIYVLNHISIKAASFAYLVCPILTTVLAYLILKEKLSRWQWVAVALSAFSCILLSFNSLRDIVYSLIIAGSYALYLVSQRKNTGIDKFLILSIQLIFAALVLLPFYPAFSGNLPTEPMFYWLILIIAVAFTIIPLYLNLYALQGVTSSMMGILLYINPLINFILAIFYFNEPVNSFQMTGYAIIFLSILIFNEQYVFGFRRKAGLQL